MEVRESRFPDGECCAGLDSLQKCYCLWLEAGKNQSDKYPSAVSCRYSWICSGARGWSRWSSDVSSNSNVLCVCLNFICCLKISSGNCDQLNLCLLRDCLFLGKEERNLGEAREFWAGLLPAGQPSSSLGVSSKACCHPPPRQKKGFWPEAKQCKLRDKQKRVACVEENESDFYSLEMKHNVALLKQ